MTKAEYLAELKKRLGALGAEERAELLADYDAHFEHGRANGRTEAEVAQRLGPPQLVAREILYQLSVDEARANPDLRRIAQAVFAGVGLGLVNVLVLLVPFAGGLLLLAGLFALAAFLLASPVLLLIQDGWTAEWLLKLPLMAGLVGAGLILWVALVKGSALFVKWMLAILQSNVESAKEKWK
jgi:Predicted membrane protein